MKKIMTIAKKSFILYMSIIAVIGLLWTCAKEVYNPGIQAPIITEIDPPAAFEGGEVIIYGRNFSSAASENVVKFNDKQATVVETTTLEITAIVPDGASSGDVTVTTNNLTSAASSFTVAIPIIPTITSIDPVEGNIGDVVTITGTDFSPIPEENIVSFNGGIATVDEATETTIITTVPPTATTGEVTVTRDRESNGVMFAVTTPIFTLTIPLADDADDAEEGSNNGKLTITSSDLELGEYDTWTQDGVEQGLQTIGIRFTNIEIPANSKILAASIQFTVDNTGENPVQLTIYGENAANPISYSEEIYYDITSRPRTQVNAVWDIPPWLEKGLSGPDQQTTDLASIVQAIVDRSDWATGNSMAFILDHSGPSIGVTSSSDGREAEAGPGDDSPTLTIIYQ